jgi:hypothetical protein
MPLSMWPKRRYIGAKNLESCVEKSRKEGAFNSSSISMKGLSLGHSKERDGWMPCRKD